MSRKWNYKTKEYDPYELPAGVSLYEEDFKKIVSCAGCGDKSEFGEMYTSKEIHNNLGFGYGVCEKCYDVEIKNQRLHIVLDNYKQACHEIVNEFVGRYIEHPNIHFVGEDCDGMVVVDEYHAFSVSDMAEFLRQGARKNDVFDWFEKSSGVNVKSWMKGRR